MIPTTVSDYHGYRQLNFTCNGHEGCLILPHTPLVPGNRWIWRAEFLGAFDSVDLDLLSRGWCLATLRISDMFGSPQAVLWMEEFRRLVVSEWDLCEKTVLEGFSRGGLYSCNYAYAYPDKVSCLYLDAPLLDIRHWPGGYATNGRDEGQWALCKGWYNLTEESAPHYADSPLNHAAFLAGAGIPVALVAGLADRALCFEENGGEFIRRYEAAGGEIFTLLKPDCDHHPHSLDDPTPLSDFIEKVTG